MCSTRGIKASDFASDLVAHAFIGPQGVPALKLGAQGLAVPILNSGRTKTLSFNLFSYWKPQLLERLRNNSFNLEIPPHVSRLRRLYILRLGYNSLVGEILKNISTCSKLVNLNRCIQPTNWRNFYRHPFTDEDTVVFFVRKESQGECAFLRWELIFIRGLTTCQITIVWYNSNLNTETLFSN